MTDFQRQVKDGKNLQEPIFKLKVSEREKYKEECKWFKEFIDYLVPYDTTVVDDFNKMKLAYDVVNNDISGFKEQLDKFCSPMGEQEYSSLGKEEILPYNKLHNKVNIFAGELLKRKDSHKIVLINHVEIAERNTEQKEAIQRSLEERVNLEIERVKMRFQGVNERALEEHMKQFRTQAEPEDLASKSFQTEWEIFNTKALKYCHYEQEIQAKKQLSIRHAIIADRVFLYSGWKYGEPVIEVLNPLHCGFHKSPDVVDVSKGDYFWHKQAITLADVYNEYVDVLTQEEINKLGIYTYSSNLRVDKRHDVLSGAKKVFKNTTEEMFRHSQDVHDKTVGQAMANGTSRRYNSERLLWRTHIEFKAYREVIFLSFTDDMGYEITEIISKDFKIPSNAKKTKKINRFNNTSTFYEWTDSITSTTYKAERLWIPRRYEVTRLGQDVYVYCREVRNQPLDINNPYKSFELSYKGRIFSNVNAASISPVQRALPFQLQVFFVHHIKNRELAKYQGYTQDIDVDQIPDYLSLDHEGNPIPGRDKVAVWRTYVKKLGVNFYSGSQSADGLPPSTRSPGSKSSLTGTAVDLINLGQMLELLDREIGMVMGISPQRESNFTRGSNVTDNQNAIAASYNLTEPYYFMHSEVWKRALNDWLKLFKIYCKGIFESNPKKKEHFINYITPNGSSELLRITSDMLSHNDVGLYLSNSGQDQFYRESMSQLVHAFGQNAGEGMETISSLIKSISAGESPEEIHKLIQIESKNQQERIARQQEASQQAEKQRQQRDIEWREDEQAHGIEKEHIKGGYGLQEKVMDIYKFQDDLNKDQDGIPDHIEAAVAMHNMRKDLTEIGQKDRELNIKEAEIIGKRSQAIRDSAIKERRADKPSKQ